MKVGVWQTIVDYWPFIAGYIAIPGILMPIVLVMFKDKRPEFDQIRSIIRKMVFVYLFPLYAPIFFFEKIGSLFGRVINHFSKKNNRTASGIMEGLELSFIKQRLKNYSGKKIDIPEMYVPDDERDYDLIASVALSNE